MRLTGDVCRDRLGRARVAHLATTGADGRPHLVPVTFALAADLISVAVDHKPKTTNRLRRLRNMAQNPAVAFLVDEYSEDWSQLWWVRADATARVVASGAEHEAAVDRIVARYPQYAEIRPAGPVILAEVTRWSGWAAATV